MGKVAREFVFILCPSPSCRSSLGGLEAQRGKPRLAAWEKRGWQDNEGRGCVGLNPGAGVEVAECRDCWRDSGVLKSHQSDGGVLKWDGSMVAQLYNCTKNH